MVNLPDAVQLVCIALYNTVAAGVFIMYEHP